ncbi:MAG: metalloregulator ArsR/SmtB family transcription factor [Caulobacter sp.]|nr:metalloregulator ArsR/SmtB family transcription factor [Caulobacter sp.]
MAQAMKQGAPRRSTRPSRPGEDPQRLALLAKALGHPARIGIVRLLQANASCAGSDIVDRIGLAQSTTAEHLRILRAAGIVLGEVDRPRTAYSLNPAMLAPLAEFLAGLAAPAGDEARPPKPPV